MNLGITDLIQSYELVIEIHELNELQVLALWCMI